MGRSPSPTWSSPVGYWPPTPDAYGRQPEFFPAGESGVADAQAALEMRARFAARVQRALRIFETRDLGKIQAFTSERLTEECVVHNYLPWVSNYLLKAQVLILQTFLTKAIPEIKLSLVAVTPEDDQGRRFS